MRGGFDGAVVLDAFAGSGALGVEALSRGASFSCFCERDRAALAALEENTSFLKRDAYRIVRGDVLKRAPSDAGPFDIVFFDPPYALDPQLLADLLFVFDAQGDLCEGTIVSYEHDARAGEGALLNSGCTLELVVAKTYGDTTIDLYRKARL